MKLSIADKLALIYTSAGSMRKTAALAGLSHQQVSRILHAGFDGKSLKYYEQSPAIVGAVDVALQIHTDLSRQVARAHDLPFDASIPVYAERLTLKTEAVYVNGKQVFKGAPADCKIVANGRRLYRVDKETGEILVNFQLTPQQNAGRVEWKKLLGDRVGALHLHWLSDALRDKWIQTSQKSGAYYQASVGSIVNLPAYMKSAAQRITNYLQRGGILSSERIKARESLRVLLKDHVKLARVFTPYTSMNPEFPSDMVTESINEKIQSRHSPAVGEKGTKLADQVLLQVDTRKSRHAKSAKASGNRRRSK